MSRAVALALALALAAVGCGGEESRPGASAGGAAGQGASGSSGAGGAAGAAGFGGGTSGAAGAAGAGGAYPSGPYGSAVGDVLANYAFAGYVNLDGAGPSASLPYTEPVTFEDLRESGRSHALVHLSEFF